MSASVVKSEVISTGDGVAYFSCTFGGLFWVGRIVCETGFAGILSGSLVDIQIVVLGVVECAETESDCRAVTLVYGTRQ